MTYEAPKCGALLGYCTGCKHCDLTRATAPDTVTLKRGELCRAIGLFQACKDWKENAASTEALKILETALKEGV